MRIQQMLMHALVVEQSLRHFTLVSFSSIVPAEHRRLRIAQYSGKDNLAMPNPPQATSLLPTGDGGSSKAASRGRREHGAETNQQDRTHSAKPKRQKTKRSGKWTVSSNPK